MAWVDERENADAYAKLLPEEILPGIHRVRGFKGAQLLWREAGDEAEFVTITLFDSLESVKEFGEKTMKNRSLCRKRRSCHHTTMRGRRTTRRFFARNRNS